MLLTGHQFGVISVSFLLFSTFNFCESFVYMRLA